jgi:hypothetical protein
MFNDIRNYCTTALTNYSDDIMKLFFTIYVLMLLIILFAVTFGG